MNRKRKITAILGSVAAAAVALPLMAMALLSGANTLPTYMSATPYSTSIATGWSASATAHPGVTSYHVQLALVNGQQLVYDLRTIGTGERFFALTPGTNYEWRLAVSQDPYHYSSPWSSWRRVSTLGVPPPPPPPSPSPSPSPSGSPTPTPTPTPSGSVPPPLGVPANLVGALLLNADGAQMLAWQHTPTGNQGQPDPGTYGLDSAGDLSLSINGSVGSFCQVAGPAFGPVGIYESRVYLPADPNTGLIADWPAWWLWGGNNADELDIIEGLGGKSASHLWWPSGNVGLGWSTIGPGWHTGTALITSNSVTVYIDGHELGSYAHNPLTTGMQVYQDIMAGTPPGNNGGPAATYLAQYTRVWAVA